jgi:hypothetical protein
VTKTCQKKIHWSYALIQDPPSPRVCSVLFLNSDRSRRDATSPLLQGAPVRLLHPVERTRARLPSTSGMECPIARPYICICFAHTAPICADLPCYSVL